MIYTIVGIIIVFSFLTGFFLSYLYLKKHTSPSESDSSPSKVESNSVEEYEQTRKVDLVDIKDLLNLDGEVIEAEPAPQVSEDKLHKAELEIQRLNRQILVLQGRDQSKEIVLAQLKQKLEHDSGEISSVVVSGNIDK
ncbi:MAG: hypothetical protein JXR95_13485 [Deltaproteobacteria bacterium]|nr:hypothetical protein [Deltaproteobacteria bacterium]